MKQIYYTIVGTSILLAGTAAGLLIAYFIVRPLTSVWVDFIFANYDWKEPLFGYLVFLPCWFPLVLVAGWLIGRSVHHG